MKTQSSNRCVMFSSGPQVLWGEDYCALSLITEYSQLEVFCSNCSSVVKFTFHLFMYLCWMQLQLIFFSHNIYIIISVSDNVACTKYILTLSLNTPISGDNARVN